MRDDLKYVHGMIWQAGGLPQIDKSIQLIEEHLTKEHLTADGKIFTTKNERLSQWKPEGEDLYNLVIKVFTTALTSDYLTYQAAIGQHSNSIPMNNEIDRVKTMAEVIAMMCIADLIDIHSASGEYHQIIPRLTLENIPFTDRHGTVYSRPQPVVSNWDPEQGNMILGGGIKFHEDCICLDYINKMNSIPMILNKEFLCKYPEEHKESYIKEDDDILDIQKKEELWGNYVCESKRRYAQALTFSNRLYLNHKPDTRGRYYAVGYYISSQNSSYKKASLQFANKEYLDDSIAIPKEKIKA